MSDPLEPPPIVDDDVDVFGAEDAAARLAERLEQMKPGRVRADGDVRPPLSPPVAPDHDRIEGPVSAPAGLVVFGAHATPSSRPLGTVLATVRDRFPGRVSVVWRHYPDPATHPRAAIFALAAEAAAASARFWALTHALLELRHHDPVDLHAALLRAGLDPGRTLDTMRAGTGTDRIVADVASGLASDVALAPALFINGERYQGELDPVTVCSALDARVGPPAG